MKKTARPPRVADVRIADDFWGEYQRLIKESVIPYQWEALNDRIPDADRSGCIHNFMVAAGRKEGEHYGWYFQDSDLYKWLEAVAYSLVLSPDEELEKTADWVIDLMADAQREDGYLDTFYQIAHPGEEWTCLREYHELYCAGHLIEAAVAYADATGKTKFLDIACRLADLIDSIFGDGEDQCKGYPGHEEIELALIRLTEKTGEARYAKLAKHFIDQRGASPSYFQGELDRDPTTRYPWGDGPLAGMRYFQADKPVRQQEAAYGHAVRACYLYSGVADVARVCGDESLFEHAKRMFANIAGRRMYVTGAIGSSGYGEAFTSDYDLPNDSVYGETCASIALAFFTRRMLQMEQKSVYADVMERAIYNTALAGMSLSGKNFFYVNPLEVEPESLAFDYYKKHVLPERPKWYGCACCPPNIARLTASIGQYAYLQNEDGAYVNLFIGGEADLPDAGFKLNVTTNYPWEGEIAIDVTESAGKKLYIRVPDWSKTYEVKVNGVVCDMDTCEGYVCIEPAKGDVILLSLDMSVRRVYANARVREDAGLVAIQCGPIVYCVEEIDNGKCLHNLVLPRGAAFEQTFEKELLGGVVVLKAQGKTLAANEDAPLHAYDAPSYEDKLITLVPYFRWNNRGKGEMRVYLRDGM